MAVTTFHANKSIDVSELSAGADFILKNTNLSENPNFNLKPALQKFHDAFFKEYINNFDFDVIDEKIVLNNEAYQAFEPDYEGLAVAFNPKFYETIEGYKIIVNEGSTLVNKDMLPVGESLNADGMMHVKISFKFLKTALGKFGYVSVQALTNITLYNNEGKSVFDFHERAGSKKKVPLVNGIPVMKPEKIQPMCEGAIEELMKDMNKKLGRLAKKAGKKL